MISTFFINRPIFATVLSILIVIAGLVSLNSLPVEQYPSITPADRCRTRFLSGSQCNDDCQYDRHSH